MTAGTSLFPHEPEIALGGASKNAIAHLYGGNSLLAHEVGAARPSKWLRPAWRASGLGPSQNSFLIVPIT
jgi:hypothetical protein